MKKDHITQIIVASLLMLQFTSASGQVMDDLETANTCSFFGEVVPQKVTTFSSDKEAESAIKKIVDASGLVQNFLVRAAGVPNAAAVIRGDTRYILYNQHFMKETERRAQNSWASISIMAHEVGHHLNGHTLDGRGSRPKIELEADYYSGFILQRLGASLSDARAAMEKLGSESGSSTHPAKRDRLAAIANGWVRACESDSKCDEDREPDVGEIPIPDRPSTPPATQRDRGYPSGYGMLVCGCWGYNPPPLSAESKCASGFVRVNICPGFCAGGGSPYAYVCQ
ncbi:hypothetical protein [Ketobacter sp.]|uniref:hypothetical protein n=1 Tax=Ketobacter sp. TaxID=2083498 RepID=UPI0025C51D26|nr:hypothetical protein [Ketobacter sp.]